MTFQPGPAMRAPALAALCLLALSTPLPAEPPTGPYLLVVVANSSNDGLQKGPQLGLLAGGRVRVSDSIALLFELSALHSPKIDAGDGVLYAATFDVEHWGRRWYAALGASYAVLKTSAYEKDAWAPRLTIGRQAGSVRLSGTWSFPDSTLNRTESLGLGLEWRRGRGILRAGLAWLRHRDGEGLRLSAGFGVDFGHRAK